MADTTQNPLDQGPTLWDVGSQADASTPASEAAAQFRARADAARDAFLAIVGDPTSGVVAGLSAAQTLSDQLRQLGGALVLQLDENRDLEAAARMAAEMAAPAVSDAPGANATTVVAAQPGEAAAALFRAPAAPLPADDAPFALLGQREVPHAEPCSADRPATPLAAGEPAAEAADAGTASSSPADELAGPSMSREAMLARFRQTRQPQADAAQASAPAAKSPSV